MMGPCLWGVESQRNWLQDSPIRKKENGGPLPAGSCSSYKPAARLPQCQIFEMNAALLVFFFFIISLIFLLECVKDGDTFEVCFLRISLTGEKLIEMFKWCLSS